MYVSPSRYSGLSVHLFCLKHLPIFSVRVYFMPGIPVYISWLVYLPTIPVLGFLANISRLGNNAIAQPSRCLPVLPSCSPVWDPRLYFLLVIFPFWDTCLCFVWCFRLLLQPPVHFLPVSPACSSCLRYLPVASVWAISGFYFCMVWITILPARIPARISFLGYLPLFPAWCTCISCLGYLPVFEACWTIGHGRMNLGVCLGQEPGEIPEQINICTCDHCFVSPFFKFMAVPDRRRYGHVYVICSR